MGRAARRRDGSALRRRGADSANRCPQPELIEVALELV
jgi:hypothetical protein